jgi:hypothetical protein
MDLNNKKSKSKTVIARISVLLLYHTFIGEECILQVPTTTKLLHQRSICHLESSRGHVGEVLGPQGGPLHNQLLLAQLHAVQACHRLAK